MRSPCLSLILRAWLVLLALVLAPAARAENVYTMDIGLTGIYSVDVTTGGTVQVNVNRTRKTVTVHAGHTYLAKAPNH